MADETGHESRRSEQVVSQFICVDIEPGSVSDDGLSLRFKRAGAESGDTGERAPRDVPYESEDGIAGRWRVFATDDPDGATKREVRAFLVEDSSDGVAWLVVGGAQGLVLEHVDTGVIVREPYLVLSKHTM